MFEQAQADQAAGQERANSIATSADAAELLENKANSENSVADDPSLVPLEELTPEQYQSLRGEYVRQGKGTPPKKTPPKD